ncbi:RHS repeat-associated core domain-containing protein [Chitinophaga sp. S165]|uniref:RHS repeat-associated core domain-containing protein n=1 Tax=Chitinophaga sp. S165 TaxID=2135462 RepID=UPI000D9CC062|nr:RHS repeat-associated core domain-containing protein [Chitinophaga sp. S165]PWV56687.1 RHS repeat-associated protein [Chitinophaga sp. S165]
MRFIYAGKSMVRLIAVVCMLCGVLQARAFNAIEKYQNQIQGELKKGDVLFLKDEKFESADWGKIHNQTVNNIITFSLYRESGVVLSKAFKCEIDLKIESWYEPGQPGPDITDHVKLNINYDPVAGVAYQDAAVHRYMNAHQVRITINDITSAELEAPLPATFRLSSQIVVERSYDLDNTAKLLPKIIMPNAGEANDVSLIWNKITGAEEYDVEWTFIDEDSYHGSMLGKPEGVKEADLKAMFRNNATRVTVQKELFDISLVNNSKYLLVRMRPVQYQDDGSRLEHPWQYETKQGAADEVKLGVVELTGYEWHEENKNWQYNAVYAEDGKKKEVVSYFDGTLRSRQTVTVNNSDKSAVVQESIYDEFGRPLVSILPVPLKESAFKYYPGLHKASDNTPYNFNHVYGNTAFCIDRPQPLKTSVGAAKYYSPLNEFLQGDNVRSENKYIPDAAGYPFAVTRYTSDNTGRVSVQGGVGELFQPGSNNGVSKATRLFYGKPEQFELDRLFGNDVGYASHYLKNVTVDGNNQVSISYQDAAGRTIATALTGDTPENLDGLPSKPEVVQKTEVVLNREFSFDASKMMVTGTATYTSTVRGPVKLNYDVMRLIRKYEENGVQICSNCYYQLYVRITDNCGKEILRNTLPFHIGFQSGSCGVEYLDHGELDATFEIGEYYMTFDLTIPEESVAAFTREYITKNTNLKSQWSFIENALHGKDFTSCFNDCTTCKESLGDLSEFSRRIKEQLLSDSVVIDDATINPWINHLYDSLSTQCAALKASCGNNSPCKDLEDKMRLDVSPGGQYALFDANYAPVEASINILNLYWRQVFNPTPETSQDYIDEQFELEDGTISSPHDSAFTLQLLVRYWRPEWAGRFVEFHPEFCALQFCRDNSELLDWDLRLRTFANTIADIPGVVTGAVYNKDNIRWLVDHDTFFMGKGAAYAPLFINDLENYSRNIAGVIGVAPVRNLVKFVDYMLYCADYTGNININNVPTREADNWTNCSPVEACRIYDREWTMYRDKYLELKERYYQRLRDSSIYCGSACPIGKPIEYPTTSCPDPSQFSLEQVGVANAAADSDTVRVSYIGVPFTQPVTISIYYPEEYKDLTLTRSVGISAGKYYVDFPVKKGIPISSLRISGVNCGSALRAAPVFSCAEAGPEDFTKLVRHDIEGYTTVVYEYTGPALPNGASLSMKVTWLLDDPDRFFPIYLTNSTLDSFPFTERGNITTWEISKVSCVDGEAPPAPTCNPAYANKVSRVGKISYATPDITTDTLALKGMVDEALALMIKQNCEAQVDTWMSQLDDCLVGKSSATINLLRNKLLEVCRLGGDAEHLNGASTLPSGRATTPEGYKSFKDVITGVLGGSMSMTCNPYLIEAPYPYEVKLQAVDHVLNATNPSVCSTLAALSSQYTAGGGGGTFYAYLQQKYGAAMDITAAELQLLQKGCNNCRYLLEKPVKLPVFMEKGAKGCITAQEYTQAMSILTGAISGGLDVAHINYETIVANYFNSSFGFTLSYADYADFAGLIAENPSSTTVMLCNRPVFKGVKQDNYECMMQIIDDAVVTGKVLYKEYIEEEKRLFRKSYIAYCGANKPIVSLNAPRQTYHYTLYYYDQAGNLVRTVPPEGVHPLDEVLVPLVDSARAHMQATCNYDGATSNTNEAVALQQVTNALDRTTNEALEMWLYNKNAGGSQVLMTGSGNKYVLSTCVNGSYLNIDVYTVTPLPTNESEIVLSAHTTVSLADILPLSQWTHIVIQGAGLNRNDLTVYVNGVLCPLATIDPTGACGWEIRSGSTFTYPKNFASLKQLRFYSRLLKSEEIAANAAEPCLGLSPEYKDALTVNLLNWSRFNTPAPGADGTIGNGSTTESQFAGIYPQHTSTTSYSYQALNGIQAQHTPDGGDSRFWYDMLGRMVTSQNAEQLNAQGRGTSNRFSYTMYDKQGRITEVGEKTNIAEKPGAQPFLSGDGIGSIYGAAGQQVTRTYYDVPKSGTVSNIADAQVNLRKRVSAVTYGEDGNGTPQQATYYSYDQIGNVKTLWQQIGDLGTKQFDYQYDLVSGKVNKVRYQKGQSDQFLYGYEYDAENRLTKAVTGINSVSKDGWEIEVPHADAAYRYFLHGPLARTELGNEQLVQGLDYAYTLQGWLKGVNGNYLSPQSEIGGDGAQNPVARDAYAYSLDYFKGDYKAIGSGANAFSLKWTDGQSTDAGRDLFNGNIARSTLAQKRVAVQPTVGYSYRYDQLNRLKGMRQHLLADGATDWSPSLRDEFKEDITYDGNGNILSYIRNGSSRSIAMDQLTYNYSRDAAGNLLNNRLSHVVDAANDAAYTEDLKTQTANNYLYDNIGNLIFDKKGDVDVIKWNLYGKIEKITKSDGSSLEYRYDAAGNRVYKLYTNGTIKESTWYVRDAQGNVLAVYGNKDNDSRIYWKEQHLYGSSRLGIWNTDTDVTEPSTVRSDVNWLKKGNKRYELTNHLGNVLATISDKAVDSVIGGVVDHYEAEILSAQDYYPFGMLQPDRQWSLGSYRYGFNGKENDNEVKGEGNQQDFGARVYDGRLGKFLSMDPLTKTYPFYSPYLYAGNSPIRYIDVYGEGPGDALELLLKMLHEAPKAGTEILVGKIAKTNIGKAVGKTTAQVYVSSLGLMNGTNNLLSFGLINKSFEELGLPEEYRGWYEWATKVGKSQPLPEGAVGPGAGSSPRLSFAGEAPVVANGANFELMSTNVVLANTSSYEYGTPKQSASDKPASGENSPARAQSRINITNEGWKHIIDRHYNKNPNASKFSISLKQLRSVLSSNEVMKWPITKILPSKDGPKYVREVVFKTPIGTDKFNNYQPTNVMTIMTDELGNLQTATPGVVK